MPDYGTIYVTARVNTSGHIYNTSTSTTPPSPFHNEEPLGEDGGGGGGGNPADVDFDYQVVVQVRVSNSANQAAAEQVANNLISAMVRLRNDSLAHPDATVTVKGVTFTLSDMVAQMTETQWTVTDVPDYHNNGVGLADYHPTGGSTEEIDFSYIYGSAGYSSSN